MARVSTRFFPTALTTGMSGSGIDPDLAASLKARERHDAGARRPKRRIAASFRTLIFEPAEPRQPSAWRKLLKRFSVS